MGIPCSIALGFTALFYKLKFEHPVTSTSISVTFLPALANFASHFGHLHKMFNFFSITLFAVVICDQSVVTSIKAKDPPPAKDLAEGSDDGEQFLARKYF